MMKKQRSSLFLHSNVYNGGLYNASKYFCLICCLHFVLNKKFLLCHFLQLFEKKRKKQKCSKYITVRKAIHFKQCPLCSALIPTLYTHRHLSIWMGLLQWILLFNKLCMRTLGDCCVQLFNYELTSGNSAQPRRKCLHSAPS